MNPTVLVAPDKFKGSLSASEVTESLAAGLRQGYGDELDIDCCPIADGGDGTLDIAVSAGFHRTYANVEGPTGERILASYAERDGVAFVELAEASGLRRLPGGGRSPLAASTYGAGQLVAHAISRGNHTVVLAIGGSATSDGGAGLVQALGARLFDAQGDLVRRGGGALRQVERVELADMKARIDGVEFVIASDVDNPLLGENGAAHVFGPQKGASSDDVDVLEQALALWSSVVTAATGRYAAEDPGSGAAGGVGFAGIAMLGARLTSGADMVLDLVRFADRVRDASLVITGEGSLDEQTLGGKGPARVAYRARQAGVAVVAAAGRCTLAPRELAAAGIRGAFTLAAIEPDPEASMANASQLLKRVGEQIAARELRGR
jgi:glycerate kinase